MNKRYLIALLVLILLSSIPTASSAGSWNGWIYQNPYPTSNTLLAVKFVTPKKGWLAGERGTILYTKDGGDTWEYQESGTEQELKSIAFVNEKVGWAVGKYGVIIHTEDGGKTWAAQQGTKATLNCVFFINDKEGWAVGDEGTVLRTGDGGKKWEKREIGIRRAIASVYFANLRTGWILAGDEVYRTTNGGNSWEKTKLNIKMAKSGKVGKDTVINMIGNELSPDWSKGGIFFTDEKNGWAVAGVWFIFHTEDGGKTWVNQLNTGYMSYGLSRIAFSDTKRGCAVGSSILCTEDGGKTWTEKLGIKPGQRERINDFLIYFQDISVIDQNIAWTVGNEGQMMKTEDSGKAWNMESRRDKCGGETFFIDNKTGWLFKKVMGTYICRTEDGGYTFQKQNVGIEVGGIYFQDSTKGWVVGSLVEDKDVKKYTAKIWAVIKHTTDGGKTWSTQYKELVSNKYNNLIDRALHGIYFVNPDIGWAVGEKGMILRTDNGGKQWKRQKQGPDDLHLWNVFFIDSNVGWAIGTEVTEKWIGEVLYTEDGGRNWHLQQKIPNVWLTNILIIDRKSIWVTGETEEGYGWLFYSEDGGKTWSQKGFGSTGNIHFYYHDKDHFLILADRGWLILTDYKWDKWKRMRSPLFKYPTHFADVFEKIK
jgi:photosystem II stability/assembly factor-like uncharacterized protein